MNLHEIGCRIKYFIDLRRTTQGELAKAIGVGREEVSAILNGKRPLEEPRYKALIEKMAKALQTSCNVILAPENAVPWISIEPAGPVGRQRAVTEDVRPSNRLAPMPEDAAVDRAVQNLDAADAQANLPEPADFAAEGQGQDQD